ncbi:amino acid adenylation domain-containing protein, partial [Senegalia sp. (in: firmicutes)]|uniref:amino acid adenylation domain-containing protein n=2 Tax=Senegalia sp. (in: firmicutes) TaxID=1924098 RepID=UPI003F9AFE39
HKLLKLGVKKEEPVVILSERSLELMASILAILKIGACYVPIDTAYPDQRIDFILDDVGANIVLCGEVGYSPKENLLIMNLKDKSLYEGNNSNPEIYLQGDNLAYIIYTSGTSGKPKGSLIEHKSIIRLVKDTNFFDFHEGIRILQTGSVAFDASTFEFFGSLLNGGTLYLVSQDTLIDVDKLSASIKQNNINTLWMTSSFFNQMLDIRSEMFKELEHLLIGGEQLSDIHVRKFKDIYPEIKLINGYGPTENTTFTTTYEIPNDFKTIPIGKPITGTQVYIMNKDMLCGIGMPGELCITGLGVSRGYLNREELTKEKFVDNPFGEGKMYRSGDLVRWLPDGNIEYLGRIDEQVKIRGYRVELKEIEEVLRNQEGIKNSVAIIKDVSDKDKAILSYVVMEEGKELNISEIKEELREELPEYMIPHYFKAIDKVPLNTNGKIDKKALPEIEYVRQKEYVPPKGEIEKLLVKSFEEVLGMNSVGLEDSFFELGGDSIKAIQVSSIVREKGYNLNIKDIMSLQTVGKICASKVIKKEIVEYSQDPISGKLVLSPIQRRFFELDLENKNHFNQSVVLEMDSRLKKDLLKKSLEKMVIHHDILRAVYDSDQIVKLPNEVKDLLVFKEVIIAEVLEENIKEEIEKIIKYEQGTMDIENGPLLHSILFHTNIKDYLMICIHHLAVDGVSWRILTTDVFTTYEQIERNEEISLPNKTASYLDWVESLKKFGVSDEAKNDEDYWVNVVSEGKITDELFSKPLAQNNLEKRISLSSFSFSKEKCTKMMKEYHEIFGIQTDEFFIMALSIALNKWKNTSSYVLEIETHGREELNKDININRTVGWFTNLFPLVITNSSNINDIAIEVRRKFLKIPNKGMTYGILKYLNGNRSLNIHADLGFNFLGDTSIENNNFKGIRYCNKFNRFDINSKNVLFHPLTVNGAYVENKVVFTNYYDGLFVSEEDIKEFEDYFVDALNDIYDFAYSDLIFKEPVNIVEEVSDVEFSSEEVDLLNQLMRELE